MKSKENARLLINIISVFVYSLIYLVFVYLSYNNNYEYDFGIRGYFVLTVIYIVILVNLTNTFGAFQLGNKRILDIFISSSFSLFFVNIFAYFELGLIEGHLINVYPHIIILLIQLFFALLFSYFGNKIIRFNYPPENTLFIYGERKYKLLVEKLKKYQKYEFNITKSMYENKINYSRINEILNEYNCVITYEIKHDNKKIIAKACYEQNKNMFDVPSILDVLIKSSTITNFIDTPLFRFNKLNNTQIDKVIKRIFDIFGAILLLVISSPLLLVVSIIIKLQDGGDVLFKQKRLTKDGKEFELIKFRSMIMNAEPNGKAIRAKENDDRITPFGRFIRSTRIDELPQIINILQGDLSFVGPRALRIEEYLQNEKNFPEFKYRLKVKAGLTGYAQIYGKYNTSFRDKLLLDVYYIENHSLITDVKLILMTFAIILKKDSTEGF